MVQKAILAAQTWLQAGAATWDSFSTNISFGMMSPWGLTISWGDGGWVVGTWRSSAAPGGGSARGTGAPSLPSRSV